MPEYGAVSRCLVSPPLFFVESYVKLLSCCYHCRRPSSRTDLDDDDVVDVTSLSALDVVEKPL